MPNMSMASIELCVWVNAAPFVSPFLCLARCTITFPPLFLPLVSFSILSPFICSFLHVQKPMFLHNKDHNIYCKVNIRIWGGKKRELNYLRDLSLQFCTSLKKDSWVHFNGVFRWSCKWIDWVTLHCFSHFDVKELHTREQCCRFSSFQILTKHA